MKKKLPMLLILSMLFLVVGCSNETGTQKTEEELKSEIKAELQAEMEEETEKVQKLSDEDLADKKDEYEAKLRSFLNNIPDTYSGLVFTDDITQFEYYNDDKEFKEYVDMLFGIGYGIEQAEGNYYLYVGQPVGYQDGEVDNTPAEDVQQKPEMLASYQAMEEYKYDLDGDQRIDSFWLQTDGMESVILSINERGYSAALEDITPELMYSKYKLAKTDDSSTYAFVFYVASPPNDYEVFLCEYQDKGYGESDSGKKEAEELKKIGVAIIDMGLFDYDFEDFFNSEINVSRDQVTIGDETFTFSH